MSEEKKQKIRRVRIPGEVASMPLIAGQPDGPTQEYPYDFWMEWLLNTGFLFNSSNQGRRWATEIAISYGNKKSDEEGEYFDVEQKPPKQMWTALKHAAEHPGGEQQPVKYPIPGRYLGEYIDSIVDAEEVEI